MKLKVALVTKIDIIGTDEAGKTYTFKLSENPILNGICVGDNIYLEADGQLKVEQVSGTEALSKKLQESRESAPVSGRSPMSKTRGLEKYR